MVQRSEAFYEMQAEVFKALSHPIRLGIVKYLGAEEHAVSEIVSAMGAEQSNVSRHLSLLRQSGVLTSRKSGLRVYYRVSSPGLLSALDAMLLAISAMMRARLDAGGAMFPK